MIFTLKMSVSDHLSAVSSCLRSASNPSWARTCRCNKILEDPRRRLRGRLGGARSRCDRWGCPPCPPPPPSVTPHFPVEVAFKPKCFCNRFENNSQFVYISERAKSFHWNEFSSRLMRRGHLCYCGPGEEREERRERKSTNIHRLRIRENCLTKLRLSTGMNWMHYSVEGKWRQNILVLSWSNSCCRVYLGYIEIFQTHIYFQILLFLVDYKNKEIMSRTIKGNSDWLNRPTFLHFLHLYKQTLLFIVYVGPIAVLFITIITSKSMLMCPKIKLWMEYYPKIVKTHWWFFSYLKLALRFTYKGKTQTILNYKRLCPCVCVSVCRTGTGLDWIISDLNTPSHGSDTDINI